MQLPALFKTRNLNLAVTLLLEDVKDTDVYWSFHVSKLYRTSVRVHYFEISDKTSTLSATLILKDKFDWSGKFRGL